MKTKSFFVTAGILAVMILAGCDAPADNVGSNRTPADVGGACLVDNDCSSGLMCAAGKCLSGAVGNACLVDDDCSSGLMCAAGKCSSGAVGNACLVDDDCSSGLMCAAGQCSDGTAGSICRLDDHCTDALTCRAGFCSDGSANTICTTNAQCTSGLCNSGACCAATRTAASANNELILSTEITSDRFVYRCVADANQASVSFWSNIVLRFDLVTILWSDSIGTRDDRELMTHDVYAEKIAQDATTQTALYSSPRSDSGAADFTVTCRGSTNIGDRTVVSLALCE